MRLPMVNRKTARMFPIPHAFSLNQNAEDARRQFAGKSGYPESENRAELFSGVL